MKIVEIREGVASIASPIRNAYIDFSKMTVSVVAVITDVVRDGKPVIGYGFNSNGWSEDNGAEQRLIVSGRANLLDSASNQLDLERIRALFDDLERKKDIAQFLDLTEGGDGVRVFIGSENKLFSLSGSSLVVSPYMNADRKVIGAVGVIGPTRLNYGRIVPIVDYTAQLVGRMLSNRS